MEKYKHNSKALALEKLKAKVDEFRAQRKKEKEQLSIMKEDLSRIQAEDEKAVRTIHELQQHIDSRNKSHSTEIIEKEEAIGIIQKEISEKVSEKEALKDDIYELKESIALLKASTTQEITLQENLKRRFQNETIVNEKEFAELLEKEKEIDANTKKTSLRVIEEKIRLEKVQRGAAIINDTIKREKELLSSKIPK